MLKKIILILLALSATLANADDSTVNQVDVAERRENLKTCLSGSYPTLCKRHLLSAQELKQVDVAERRENLKTCLSGSYPTLCKRHLLSVQELKQVDVAERRENLKTCLSGSYPTLCKRHLLSGQELEQVGKAIPKVKTGAIEASAYISPLSGNSFSGSKNYSYGVEGYADDGSYLYGDVDVTQSGGSGYIYEESGTSIYVDVEWQGRGVLGGYDDNGNYYELEVQ